MAVLYRVSLALLLIDCVLLAVVVLFQDSRSGGLAGALGGGVPDSAFGARTAEKMSRLTVYLAVAFFVLAFATGLFYRNVPGRGGYSADSPPVEQGAPAMPMEGMPAMPDKAP